MLGYKRIVIAEHERGMQFQDRSLVAILTPGVYHFFDVLDRISVETFNLSAVEFTHPQLDTLLNVHREICEQHFHIVETGAQQVGLVYKNGVLSDILEPDTRTVYWQGSVAVQVSIVDISENFRIGGKLASQLARPRGALLSQLGKSVYAVEVSDNHIGLLIVDGELRDMLQPGLHAFWLFGRTIKVERVDLRMQVMEVQGQEILSKDKVSLRVNLSANYRVTDAVKARNELGDFIGYVYRTLQFALRQAVGTRTLDALLGDKGALDNAIFEHTAADIAAFGITLQSVGVKDVILPGEMKALLNHVVEAEKIAQANTIKRREETAATRSLLNTAKLMETNPTLMRLKELETLESLTENIGNLTVFGGLDSVLNNMVRLNVSA